MTAPWFISRTDEWFSQLSVPPSVHALTAVQLCKLETAFIGLYQYYASARLLAKGAYVDRAMSSVLLWRSARYRQWRLCKLNGYDLLMPAKIRSVGNLSQSPRDRYCFLTNFTELELTNIQANYLWGQIHCGPSNQNIGLVVARPAHAAAPPPCDLCFCDGRRRRGIWTSCRCSG